MPVRAGCWRADRRPRPETLLPLRGIRPSDGWCDASLDRRYNRHVTLPYPASAEAMWRDDGLYDFVLDLGWNRGQIRPGRGSAIFLHVARPGFLPTEGCIALEAGALRRLLRLIGPKTELVIM
jgi:L,D-peptidoglycan transpeptidase YkuD (ErfK/YbiS/YcfS/YnhG family)